MYLFIFEDTKSHTKPQFTPYNPKCCSFERAYFIRKASFIVWTLSQDTQTWTQLLLRRTRAESTLGKVGKKQSLNFGGNQHFLFMSFLPFMFLLVSSYSHGLMCWVRTSLFWKLHFEIWTFLAPYLLSCALVFCRVQSLTHIPHPHKCILDFLLMMMH